MRNLAKIAFTLILELAIKLSFLSALLVNLKLLMLNTTLEATGVSLKVVFVVMQMKLCLFDMPQHLRGFFLDRPA